MEFRSFLEAFPYPGVKELENNPLVLNSTFGVEIEFKAYSAPLNGLDKLSDGDDDVPEDLWNYDTDGLWGNIKYQVPSFQRVVAGYWSHQAQSLIQSCSFRATVDRESSNELWAVGPDSLVSGDLRSSEDKDIAIVEIRTGVLIYKRDLYDFKKFLRKLAHFINDNKQFLGVDGETGLHIHVSNPGFNKSKNDEHDREMDSFARLATIVGIDEKKIWDDLVSIDRQFERHARLQYTSNSYQLPYHDEIIKLFLGEDVHLQRKQKSKSWVMNRGYFDRVVSSLSIGHNRNTGINTQTEQPTVEYRYLSSAMLLNDGGADKVCEYIQYFVQHAASRANKNRITIKGEDGSAMIFTRVQNGIRIDYIVREDLDQPKFGSDTRNRLWKIPSIRPVRYPSQEDMKNNWQNYFDIPKDQDGKRLMTPLDRERLEKLRQTWKK